MKTKFDIGDPACIYDVTDGIIEGVITQIHTKAHKHYTDNNDVQILSYTTRYSIENRKAEYIDIPEHVIYRTRKELAEMINRNLNRK